MFLPLLNVLRQDKYQKSRFFPCFAYKKTLRKSIVVIVKLSNCLKVL